MLAISSIRPTTSVTVMANMIATRCWSGLSRSRIVTITARKIGTPPPLGTGALWTWAGWGDLEESITKPSLVKIRIVRGVTSNETMSEMTNGMTVRFV